MKRTRKNTKPDFIVVYGAPRTGTSLTMDIVQAAGFNAGECYAAPENPRRGRNEHRLFGQPVNNWSRVAFDIIEEEKITCAKVIGYPKWIQFLEARFNVKILAPNRDIKLAHRSAEDMLLHVAKTDKAVIQNTILHKRDNFLIDWDGEARFVDFDKLIRKDKGEFNSIKNFLGYKGKAEDLMAPVDIDRVKFSGVK